MSSEKTHWQEYEQYDAVPAGAFLSHKAWQVQKKHFGVSAWPCILLEAEAMSETTAHNDVKTTNTSQLSSRTRWFTC